MVANGARTGSIRPRSHVSTLGPDFDFNSGARPPVPFAPWQAAHPLLVKSCAPSLAVPRPAGSSAPSGPMEISNARSSSAVGVRPTPYLGDDCANTDAPRNNPRSSTHARNLCVPILHAPIAGDPPRLNRVVQPGHLAQRHVEELGDLGSRRLHLSEFVRAARKQHGLFSIPVPGTAEPGRRHPLGRSLELGVHPVLAVVGGDLHLANRSAPRPGQAADLVETLA